MVLQSLLNWEYSTLLGGFLYSLALGSMNSFGNMLLYIVSWQKTYTMTLVLEDVAIVIPCCLVIVYVMISLSIQIGEKIGFKKTLYLVAAGYPTLVYLSSFSKHFMVFSLVYSSSAMFMGMAFMLPFFCGWERYPNHRGKVTGVITCSLSLSPFLFNYLTYWLANPDNLVPELTFPQYNDNSKYFDERVTARIPFMLQGFAYTLWALCFLGAALITTPTKLSLTSADPKALANTASKPAGDLESNDVIAAAEQVVMEVLSDVTPQVLHNEDDATSSPPKSPPKKKQVSSDDKEGGNLVDESQDVDTTDSSPTTTAQLPETPEKAEEMTLKTALKSAVYLKLYFMNFAGLLFPIFMMVFFKNYGLEKIPDDRFLSTTGSVSSLVAAGAGLVFGYVTDRFSFKTLGVSLYGTLSLAALVLPFASTTKAGFLLVNLVSSIGVGGSSAIYPHELTATFGNSLGGQLYGIATTANVVAFSIIVAVVYCFKELLTYDGLVYVFGLACLVSFAMTLRHKNHVVCKA